MSFLAELSFYIGGFDSFTSRKDACCSTLTSACCCLPCVRVCCAPRRLANHMASKNPRFVVLGPASTESKALIGRSFAGTASTDPERSMNWVLGPQLADFDDPMRYDAVSMWLSYSMASGADGGIMLGVKKNDGSGDLGACMIIIPYRSVHVDKFKSVFALSDIALTCRLCLTGDLPSLYTDSKNKDLVKVISKRMDKDNGIMPTMTRSHKENAAFPHWYVNVMAVDPSAQGQKCASLLMRAASEQADVDGLPLYLEASGLRNKAIYEHFGYNVVKTYTLEVEGDEPGSEPFNEFYAMVRPVKGPPVEFKEGSSAIHPTLQTIGR